MPNNGFPSNYHSMPGNTEDGGASKRNGSTLSHHTEFKQRFYIKGYTNRKVYYGIGNYCHYSLVQAFLMEEFHMMTFYLLIDGQEGKVNGRKILLN